MWIVLNKSFLSIVKNRNNENELLVRARVKGDIEKVFENADVFEDENADYKYRAYIDRKNVADKISDELLKINYDNFKNSVSKDEYNRKNAYMNVWSALNKLQK
tara:strand:+ start:100 stop:411 length:312 start_codon:yes stop_codon:yes gene_type:complete